MIQGEATDNQENAKLSILVVEDDLFQRLLISDLLDSFDYEVSLAANGQIAWGMLTSGNNDYDLILVDYMMPELDGFELLTLLKKNEQLKDIPVIMMSSNGEEQYVGRCVDNGARDYFIKPIRRQDLMQLPRYINNRQNRPFLEYEILSPLGRDEGAFGSIHLVRSHEDGQLYALKQIRIQNNDPNQRRLAENELTLLKVLNSPCIIHYYKDFMRNGFLHIVMEYAEGGSLNKVLKEHQVASRYFSNDQILDWVSQIVLALSLIHSRNILHRDIKPENIFLSKDHIVKLGDFGISKSLSDQESMARTWCGTPYYMSPEVWNHNPYNQKADIWALGCTIYEIASLKRPFDGNDREELMKNILEQEPEPLPDHVDQRIRMLIYLMLDKNPDKRPNIWQIAHIEYVHDRIVKILKQHNLDISLLPPKDVSKPAFPMNKLAEVGWNIRNSIELKSVNVGLFTKLHNVVTGEALHKWFIDHMNFDYQESIETVIDTMLQQEILFSPNGPRKFQNSPNIYYQFQMDRPGIAANMTRIFKGQAQQGLQVSKKLVEKMNKVLKEVLEKNKADEIVINTQQLKISKPYVEFVEASAELQAIQISSLQKDEKIACFLNIYQIMRVHSILNEKSKEEVKQGWVDKIQSIVKAESSSFHYVISQMEFTLDDIRHGILRGNKKSPAAYYFKPFTENDMRNKIVKIDDPRILLLLHLDTEIPEKLQVFDSAKLDEQLDSHCTEYLEKMVEYDGIENTLILPKIFNTYKQDFGSHQDIIKLAKNHCKILAKIPDSKLLEGPEPFSITYYEKSKE